MEDKRLCDDPKEHLRDIVIVANNQLATLDFSNLMMRNPVFNFSFQLPPLK